MNKQEIRQICTETRITLGYNESEPIIKFFSTVAKSANYNVDFFDFDTNNIDALVTKEGQVYSIKLNQTMWQNINRVRFTLAHEIGHCVLNHLNANEEFKDVLMRSNGFTVPENKILFEQQANYFAGEFLVPTNMVKQKMEELSNEEKLVKFICETYKVSKQVATIKVEHAKALS